MKRHKKYDPKLVSLNRQQVESAKRVNGQAKRIAHELLCGPYGQIFGTEKQCLKYYSVWLEVFPLLFAKRKRVKRAKLSDYKSTFNLVNDLTAAQDAISKHYRVPPRPSASSADKKVFSASLRVLRGQKGVLRVPPRPPRTKRCSPRPSASSADKKVFSASLRVPPRTNSPVTAPSPPALRLSPYGNLHATR